MEAWKECLLSDVVTFQRGYDLPVKNMVGNKYPVVGSNGIIGWHNEYTTEAPSITIGRSGNVGKPFLYNGKTWSHNTTLFIKEYKNTEPYFIYYFLKTLNLAHFAGGSAVPTLNRNHIHSLSIRLPPLSTQQKIAAVLSALDDKIELNRQINANLEQQAQAIFKNWFVDFEPFGGQMPAGWRVGKLSEILMLKKTPIQPGENTSLPYLPIDLIPIKSLALKEVRPNEEALSSLLKFEENDILIGAMRVYFHRVAIAPFAGITRTTCFVLEPKNLDFFAYAAITCNQDEAIYYAQKTSKGSTMPYAVWDGGLGEYEILIPDNETAGNFNAIVKPLIEQIKKSYFENKTLAAIRDTLLPKLMSGEVDVSSVKV